MTLKLTTIGIHRGDLPEAMLERTNIGRGDMLYAVEAPDGSYRLTADDPDFAATMEKADDIVRRYRHTSRTLAE